MPNRPLTEKEIKEYTVISNTHAGEFDFDILAADFGDIDLGDIGFDIPGLDLWESKKDKEKAAAAKEDDFDVPAGGIETNIKEGDIFNIGAHRLICGSSTLPEVWWRLMQDEKANLAITDPPYNVAYTGKTKDALTIQNDKQSDSDFYQFLLDFYRCMFDYSEPGCSWYIWHADSEGSNFSRAMEEAGVKVRQCLIWVKNSMVMGRQDYHWKHETCLYGWKEGSHKWYSDRRQTTVLNFDRPSRNAEHPTMKPIPLIAYQMANNSKKGDIVVDAFGGSGTTMVTCQQLDRQCRMIELDPKYCQVIINRMLKLVPGIPILKNGEEWNPNEPIQSEK